MKDEVPSLMEEFAAVADIPFHISPKLKDVTRQFVCKLYSNESTDDADVDLLRMKVFSHRT